MRAHASSSRQQHQFTSQSRRMQFAKVLAVFCALIILGDAFEFGEKMFGQIKSGFEMAGKMLGLDRASGVAQLVTEAFGRTSRKGETGDQGSTIFSGFLRILGLDTKRIGAIAVNAIIFVAQLISTSLSKPPPPYLTQARSIKDGTPLDWILTNPNIKDLLSHAKDGNLPHEIIEYLRTGTSKDSTGCLQLLVCKSAPFIWGMQKAVNAKGSDVKKGMAALTAYLPSVNEVADNGDECETKHPHCALHI